MRRAFASLSVVAMLALQMLPGCHDVDAFKPCAAGTIHMGNACAPAQSCVGLPETCGPGGDDSCCATGHVPGGDFVPFDDAGGNAQEGTSIASWQNPNPFHTVIGDFYLDRYEVTVGRFKRFLATYDQWLHNNVREGEARDPNLPEMPTSPAGRRR